MNFLKFTPRKKSYVLTEERPSSENEAEEPKLEGAGGAYSARNESHGAEEARKYRLDARGQVCPFPLVEAKRAIGTIEPGDYLTIDFDCTQATDSIPAWAADSGHNITDFQQLGDATWSITVRKGAK